jgi:hypothetical protein
MFNKNNKMKKVLLVLAVAGLMFASCNESASGKYRIINSDGTIYRTDNYTISDGCITFKCESCNSDVVTICGSYTIGSKTE